MWWSLQKGGKTVLILLAVRKGIQFGTTSIKKRKKENVLLKETEKMHPGVLPNESGFQC